jgi:hypothetical protein
LTAPVQRCAQGPRLGLRHHCLTIVLSSKEKAPASLPSLSAADTKSNWVGTFRGSWLQNIATSVEPSAKNQEMEDDSCGTEGASRWTAIMRSDTVYGNNGFEYLQPTSFPPAAQQIPQPHQQVARSQHDGPHYVARSPIDAQNRDSDNRTRPSHAATSFIATTQHIAAPNISHSESTVDGRYRMLGTAMRWNVVNVDEPCTGDQNFVTLDHVSQGQRLIHIGTGNLVDPASSPHIAFGPSFGVAGTIPSSNESWWSEQTPETPNNDSIYPPSIEELEDVPTAPRQPLHSPWTYVAATGAMMQSQAYEPSTLPNRISAAGSSRTTYQPTTSSVLQSRPRMSSDSSWDRRPNKTSHSMSTLQPPTTSYGQLQSGHGTASYSMEAAHQSQYLRKSFEDGRTRR